MAFLPTKILRVTTSSTAPVAAFSGADDGWLGYPYRWSTFLSIVPQRHGSRETPTPYFYTGNDVNVGDYVATTGRGRILKIVSISSKTTTTVACTVEDENRQNILSDGTTSGDGGIPDGEGLLFVVKNGWPILHPLPDALAGNLPAYFASDILGRFLNNRSTAIETHASTHAVAGTDPLAPGDIGAAPVANPTFTGVIAAPAGSATAPTVIATGDSDTGLFFPTANTFAVSTNGVERLSVNSAGNLRLGTQATANAPIDVQVSNTETYPIVASGLLGPSRAAILVRNTANITGSFAGYSFYVNRADAGLQVASIGAVSNEDTVYAPHLVVTVRSSSNGQTERLRITAAGNVGIGTTTPASRLDVNGVITAAAGTAAAPAFVATGDSNTGVLFPTSDTFAISTGGVERLRVDSGGNVSVGGTGSVNHLRLFSAAGLTVAPATQTGGLSAYAMRTHINSATYAGTAVQHGIVALKFPFATSTGIRFRIRGLDMQTTASAELWSFDYGVYASTTFMGNVRSFAVQGLTPFSRVRILVKNGEYFLALGEIGNLWQYPHLVADVDFFYSNGSSNNANSLQWVTITDETGYALYSANHDITIENVYPASGGVGIGTRTPTTPLAISSDAATLVRQFRPSATGTNNAKVSGNDQEVLYTFEQTGSATAGVAWQHNSYEPAASFSAATWGTTGSTPGQGIAFNAPALGYNESGAALGMNAAGNRVVVGAPKYSSAPTTPRVGATRVFQFDETSAAWTIVGAAIIGESAEDQSGSSVAMNAAGTLVAVGAPFNAGGGADAGHVRVYEYLANSGGALGWTQRGADIDGGAGERSGTSVSLDDTGTLLAIGSPNYSTATANIGRVRVFRWNDTATPPAWQQFGPDVVGTVANSFSGTTVALSGNGDVLAVFNFTGAGSYGNVNTYFWDGATWGPLGQTLEGATLNAEFGRALALSADGSRLAVGAPGDSTAGANQGAARVYAWNNTTSSWDLLNNPIFGEAAGDRSGTAIDLTADGRTLIVGAPLNRGAGTAGSNRGHARIFTNPDNAGWQQIGADLDGAATNDRYGSAVALSDAGDRIVVGAPFFTLTGAVTFQSAADTVTRSGHGFVNGNAMSFASVGTAGGVAANTTYYVINATTNTFQLATTPGGTTPVDITADSSTGTLNMPNYGRHYIYKSTLGAQTTRNRIRMTDSSVAIEDGAATPAVALHVDTAAKQVGVGIGTGLTAPLDINGNTLRLRTARTPASATAAGNVGDVCWDANYVYVCVAANTWRRALLAAW